MTARYIADRLGVTEEQVLRWRDIFIVAGTIALADELRGTQGAQYSYLSTCIPDDPTTTTTTTPDPTTGSEMPTFEPGGFPDHPAEHERGRRGRQQRPRKR